MTSSTDRLAITPEIQDRARGALVGLAVGDVLGTTLEFAARDSRPHHTEITGGGPFNLEPGGRTDDTSMTLALANSLIACKGFDPYELMTRFVAWWRDGAYSHTGTCFDIGMATAQALARFERTSKPFAGSTDADQAANGSLMRLLPVGLFHLDDLKPPSTSPVSRAVPPTVHPSVSTPAPC